jgi:parvulin-like peptidyl-prolyl isomerase
MSEDVVMELIRNQIRSDLLGRRVEEALDLPVSEETSRVHAAHILVATDQEIAVARARIVGDGEPFEVVAAEVSLDSNAFKGGDLGWFTEETMVAEFSEVAFSTPVGEVSLPVQTQFGWHIIKVYDKVTEPATSTTIRQRKAQAFQEWRTGLLEEADISQPDSLAGFIPDFEIPPQLLGS